jgi:hypothetical protein
MFWGSVDIYKEYDSLYILERNEKKTHRLCVYGYFRELLPIVLRFQGDLQGRWHLVHVWVAWPKTHHFCILVPFLWAIAHSFGVLGDLQGPWHLVHIWVTWPKTHRFCVYGRFRELLRTNLGFQVYLQGPWHVLHVWVAWPKTHRFLRFRAVFTSYCPWFWGFGVIYKDYDT